MRSQGARIRSWSPLFTAPAPRPARVGESASVAGRQSPSAEPSRSAATRAGLQAADDVLEQGWRRQESLDQPAQRDLGGECSAALRSVGARDVAAGQDRIGGGTGGAKGAVDALAGERIHEARRIADQQPARPGRRRYPVTDRRRAANRRQARAARRAGERLPAGRRWPPRSARGLIPWWSIGRAIPTLSSPPGVGASPT